MAGCFSKQGGGFPELWTEPYLAGVEACQPAAGILQGLEVMLFGAPHLLHEFWLFRTHDQTKVVRLERLHVSTEISHETLAVGKRLYELSILVLLLSEGDDDVEGMREIAVLVVDFGCRLCLLRGCLERFGTTPRVAEERDPPTAETTEGCRIIGQAHERGVLTGLLVAGGEPPARALRMTKDSLKEWIELCARIRKCLETGYELVGVSTTEQILAGSG